MTAPVLVLTIGNESRGDDALGPFLLRHLTGWLELSNMASGVELIEEFQLQIENTLDLKGRELVLFIDAGKDTQPPFIFYEAIPQRLDGHTSHAIAPEALLGVYAMVHGEEPPPMFILCIAGKAFELGEPLTHQAVENLQQASDFARGLFERPELNTWRSLAHGYVDETDPVSVGLPEQETIS
jgi:hydrogenase maturation protease